MTIGASNDGDNSGEGRFCDVSAANGVLAARRRAELEMETILHVTLAEEFAVPMQQKVTISSKHEQKSNSPAIIAGIAYQLNIRIRKDDIASIFHAEQHATPLILHLGVNVTSPTVLTILVTATRLERILLSWSTTADVALKFGDGSRSCAFVRARLRLGL